MVGRTNQDGYVTLHPAFTDDTDAMVIIKKEGYSTLVAKCPCEGLTYAISPVMDNLDGVRIVLTWGEFPADLDSHIWYKNQHVYFNNKEGHKANLDVDDVDSYGPETITVEEKEFGTEYTYAVHNYTMKDAPESYSLSRSSAKVFVYIGQSLIRTYYVPQNEPGNLWTVFRITREGEIEDINNMSGVNVRSEHLTYNTSGNNIASNARSDRSSALRYNDLGTEAYENKNYPRAIELYLTAIDYDPTFGQAYGNLALAYKRNDQYAEALWANRKAIALASGANAHITRAGAYYNIGRIYEERGEYEKAREQYRLAKSESDKPTYDTAIQRMTNAINNR